MLTSVGLFLNKFYVLPFGYWWLLINVIVS